MDQQRLGQIVAKLRRQGTDDGEVEVKASAQRLSTDVWDSVSAFANTAGGLIVLGLSEDAGFRPVPALALDRVRDQFVDGMGEGNPSGARLGNPPAYRLSRLEVDGSPVLVVEIEEGLPNAKPCYVVAKGLVGGSFKRVDDKDIRLSASEIFELQNVLVDLANDRAVVAEATLDDLDPLLVDALVAANRGGKSLRGVSERAAMLTRLNVTDREGAVRLAGLLALGSYPQQFAPRLLVDVAVHPTTEKSTPSTQLRFLDRVECDGALAEVVADAVSAIARNLHTYSIVSGSGRRDQLEIPQEVLREAVANAVVHREYHPLFRGQPVVVDIYPDRVSVTSPGGLWGGKTLDNIDDGVSRCRNQTLLQMMQRIPTSGGGGMTVEGQGGGVRLMINQMRAHSLEPPMFFATPDQVTVELRRHGAEVPEHRAWVRSVLSRDPSDHEDVALLLCRRNGHVTPAMLHDALRIDSDQARALLRSLLAEGALRLQGPQDYVLADDSAPRRGDIDVLNVLSTSEPLDIHSIAAALGKSPGALRHALRRLVESGKVIPTAGPSSRNRRYLRVQ